MGLEPNRIHQGDCIEELAKIEPGTVDLAFADPPFNIGYDYDVYHDRRAAEEYLDWSRRWISGVGRALKPNGTFWLAIGDEYAAELKLIATKDLGFACRSWVVWYYTFGVNCVRGFSRSHTHLFHFVKDPEDFTFNADNPAVRVPSARQLVYADARANPRGRLPDNTWILRPQDVPGGFAPDHDIWYFPRVAGTFKEREGFHGCQMPEQLLGRIIRCSSSPMEIVLDPFAGSGTTLAVAKKLGRQFLGIELSKDYATRTRERLDHAHSGDPLDGVADPLSSVPGTFSSKARHKRKSKSVAAQNSTLTKTLRPSARPDGLDRGIIAAYKASNRGFSVDHILANPDLNAAFVEACKANDVPAEAAACNQALLRIRKSGKLPRAARGKNALTFRQMDPYSYAAEIALAQLTVEFDATLDGILCSPRMAARFDEVAAAFSPGYTPFEYRWAALSLRKRAKQAKRLAQDRYAQWLRDKLPRAMPLAKTDWSRFDAPGVYVLGGPGRLRLYVGEAMSVRARIERLAEIPSWTRLAAASAIVIPEDRAPYALQSVLIERLGPLMNWRMLVRDGEASPEQARQTRGA